MMFLEQFHFLRPYWLLAFVPLAWILWSMAKSSLISRSWESVVDKQLLPFILVGNTTARGVLPSLLLALCGTLAIIALAGPVWEKLPQPVFSTHTALVLALDLSRSMNVADITPSRVERARFKISDLLAKRAEGQTALLVYAGDAFAVTPLTDDVATIDSQLQALTTDIIPAQGNRTDIAINMAIDLLKKGGAARGDILLITDEVDLDRSAAAAQDAKSNGYRLSILGVGTEEGAPIVKADGGFLTDVSENIIVPKLVEAPMQQLVALGGGRYSRVSLDDADIEILHSFFSTSINDDVTETEFETDVWREQGPWLVIMLIPLAAVLFRRGYLIVLFVACLPWPQPVQALDWDSLWTRQDQRAKQALDQGDAARAAELFEDPAWKGAAHYRAGNFDEAILSLDGLEQIDNNYNLGNAMARKGELAAAIALYDKVLEADPAHEDAKFNKELLEKELEQQQQQQQSQQDNQHKDENQEQDEQNQQQNQQQDQQDQQQQQQQDQQQNQDQQDPQQNEQQQQQEEQQQQPSETQEQQESDADVPRSEQKQATEQWLRRIPDDPGGLLRRKFLYQYQQRDHDRDPGEKTW